MERHFILPLTIAAAVHAGLLFGIRGNPAEVLSVALKPALPPEHETSKIEIQPPPDATVPSPGREAPSAPISLDERPPMPRLDDFVIELPRAERATNVMNRIVPVGPPGIQDGIGPGGPPIFSYKDLDGVPRARLQTRPVYPTEARRGGLAGEVLVEFTVDETGIVLEPRAVRSSDRIFEDAAVRAVARWRFEPGLHGGRAVRFRMVVPIVFSIDNN